MTIVGPLFWHDLRRLARRHNLAFLRSLYGLALLGVLFLTYLDVLTFDAMFSTQPLDGPAMRRFAERFLGLFAGVQLLVVILLTPAFAANALGEERGRNTLLFLLATQLTGREIVFGKLLTRLMFVAALLLTGLPVLAFLQLLGGVDPKLVLAAFAVPLITLLSLGCIGVACGALARKPDDAPWRAYQIALLYGATSAILIWAIDLPTRTKAFVAMGGRLRPTPGGGRMPAPTFRLPPPPPPTVPELLGDWFSAGNPVYLAVLLGEARDRNTLDGELRWLLGRYVLFHGGCAMLGILAAGPGLRWAAKRAAAGVPPSRVVVQKPTPHPKLGDRPVLWKEVYCDSKPRQRWLAWFFGTWFYWASMIPAFLLAMWALDYSYSTFQRTASTLLQSGSLLGVGALALRAGVHAARSIAAERERDTLDSLLATVLPDRELFHDKWLGAWLVGRWMLLWITVHWGYGVLCFALHPLCAFMAVGEAMLFTAFAVSLGMWCGLQFKSVRGATVGFIVIGLLATAVVPYITHAVLAKLLPPEKLMRGVGRFSYSIDGPDQFIVAATDWGLMPGRLLFETMQPWNDSSLYGSHSTAGDHAMLLAAALVISAMVYGVATAWLGLDGERRFRQLRASGVRPVWPPRAMSGRPDMR